MPLVKGKSEKAFKDNVRKEYKEGKPLKQSLAIAYSMKRKGKAQGGKIEHYDDGGQTGAESAQDSMRKAFGYDDGGPVTDDTQYTGHVKTLPSPTPTDDSEETLDARSKASQGFKSALGFSKGGDVYNVETPEELLHKQVKPGFVPDHPQYEWVPGIASPENVAAAHEDDKDLNQHRVGVMDSHKYDLVDRIMNKESQDFSGEARLADGGYVDDEDDIVQRIMHKRDEPFSDLDRYSEGGKVANKTPITAGFSPNEFDDLVLRGDLESTYGDDDNSGDALGNDREDEDRRDIVARIMASRRKKDRLPSPA